jgi:uncharacterized protein (TIGR03067 family)
MIRVFLAAVFLAGIFGLVLADEPKADDVRTKAAAKELETFAGIWEIAAVKSDGATKEARRLVFKKNWTYAPVDKDGKELWAGTFDLNPTATPKIWDHRLHESKENGGDALGIYELDGDTLKVCCVVGTWKGKEWTGKAQPKEFKLGGAEVLIDLRRVKPNGK